MTRIFLSYSRANLFIARTFVQKLQSRYTIWFDHHSILGGSEWEHEIKKGLKEAHIILVLVTPASVRSQWVAKEIAIGKELRRDVIPVIVERLESVETDLQKLGLEQLQALDFTALELDLAYEQLFRQIDRIGITWARFHPLIRDLKLRYPDNAAAAEELGNLGDSRAIPYLMEMLFSDDDSTARGTAAIALGKTIKITNPQPNAEIDQSLILKNGARLINLKTVQNEGKQYYLVGDVSKGSKIYALTMRKRGKKLIYTTRKDELHACEAKNQEKAEFAYEKGEIKGCKEGKYSISVGF